MENNPKEIDMTKVSEMLGKPIISLAEATVMGTVSNMFFDERLSVGKFLAVFREDDDQTLYVPLDKIECDGEDALVVRTSSCAVSEISATPSPINSFAFSVDGKALGSVRDLTLDGKRTISILVDGVDYPIGKLITLSTHMIILNTTDKPFKMPKKNVKTELEQPVIAKPSMSMPRVKANGTPDVSAYGFLIGKRLQVPLYAADGQKIAQENTIIDETIIASAKANGKLVQLALHSL